MKEKVGRKVIVTKRMYGHEFEIGETILVVHYSTGTNDYLCRSLEDSSIDWWLQPEEFKDVHND